MCLLPFPNFRPTSTALVAGLGTLCLLAAVFVSWQPIQAQTQRNVFEPAAGAVDHGEGDAAASDAGQADAEGVQAKAEDGEGESEKEPEPLEQVTLEATFTDAAGPFTTWRSLSQHPMLVTFFYTRDRDAKRSRWSLEQLADFQKQLLAAELAEGVYLVGLTVDPRYDQAHRLKKTGQSHGLAWPAARLLQPKYDDLPRVAGAFALAYEQVDVETIAFEPALLVLAPGGEVLYEARGRSDWQPDKALEALKAWTRRQDKEDRHDQGEQKPSPEEGSP